MSHQTDLRLAKWPFAIAYAGLLGCAVFLYVHHGNSPLARWEILTAVACVAVGSVLAIVPFIMEYQGAVKMVETGAMVSTIEQLQQLETIAKQIGGATGQWQGIQEHSVKTVASANEIADRMAREAAAFTEFLKKSTDVDRANLRLEIDKMRRSETEFLQIIVRMLDHTYMLHQAAVRSGQTNLIDQLSNFQNACRDVVRRIGLVPFTAAPDAFFDPKVHNTPDSEFAPLADARVRETLATGFTYQGQLIRHALVSLHSTPNSQPAESIAPGLPNGTMSPQPSELPPLETKVKAISQKADAAEQTLL
jgi:molecular chaperone GrpE (heat shock protein)